MGRENVPEEYQLSYAQSLTIDDNMMMMRNLRELFFFSLDMFALIPTLLVRYSTFVRIGSGLSFADYVWVRDKPWKPWDPKHPPEFLQTAKRGQDDKGDVYLNPEEYACFIRMPQVYSVYITPSSFILKVKAAEITPSGNDLFTDISTQSRRTRRPIPYGIHNAIPSGFVHSGRPQHCRLYVGIRFLLFPYFFVLRL
jgi:hypothetical protein